MAKFLILFGAACIFFGLLWAYAPGLLNWFGKLPGDINIQTGNTRVYIPITSMILVSVALSVLWNLISRF